jgi:hypothetical protein
VLTIAVHSGRTRATPKIFLPLAQDFDCRFEPFVWQLNLMPTLNWIGEDAVINHHLEVPFRLMEEMPELSCC